MAKHQSKAIRGSMKKAAVVGTVAATASALAMTLTAPTVGAAAVTDFRAVDLAASTSPFERYEQVFEDALDNAKALREAIGDDRAPIFSAIVSNQRTGAAILADIPGAYREALGASYQVARFFLDLASTRFDDGDTAGGVEYLVQGLYLAGLIPLNAALTVLAFSENEQLEALFQNPFENLSNVVNVLTDFDGNLPVFQAAFDGTVSNSIAALLNTITTIVDAEGDREAIAEAVASFGPSLVDAVLNDGGIRPGVLAPGGFVSELRGLRARLANAITPLPEPTTAFLAQGTGSAQPGITNGDNSRTTLEDRVIVVRAKADGVREDFRIEADEVREDLRDKADELREDLRDKVGVSDERRARADEVREDLRGKADEFRANVRDKADEVRANVRDKADDVRDRLGSDEDPE